MIHFLYANESEESTVHLRKHGESQLIAQLRRENAMLKKQLEGMIRMQMQAQTVPARSSPIQKVAPTPFSGKIHLQEDSPERAYRNKMSKLKAKKSNRGSTDHSSTTPYSP